MAKKKKTLNVRVIFYILITIGLILGFSYYKKTQTTNSSASEGKGSVTKLYVDSSACPASRAWIEKGFRVAGSGYDNRFPWSFYHQLDTLVPINLEPGSAAGMTDNSQIILYYAATDPKPYLYSKAPYLPNKIEIVTACIGTGPRSMVYVYRCLAGTCAPPEGKDPRKDVPIDQYFGFVRSYGRNGLPQDASWAKNPGNYTITTWCDSRYFPCGQ